MSTNRLVREVVSMASDEGFALDRVEYGKHIKLHLLDRNHKSFMLVISVSPRNSEHAIDQSRRVLRRMKRAAA